MRQHASHHGFGRRLLTERLSTMADRWRIARALLVAMCSVLGASCCAEASLVASLGDPVQVSERQSHGLRIETRPDELVGYLFGTEPQRFTHVTVQVDGVPAFGLAESTAWLTLNEGDRVESVMVVSRARPAFAARGAVEVEIRKDLAANGWVMWPVGTTEPPKVSDARWQRCAEGFAETDAVNTDAVPGKGDVALARWDYAGQRHRVALKVSISCVGEAGTQQLEVWYDFHITTL